MRETRQVTEVKIWLLALNPMTDRTGASRNIAIAFEKQKLIDWRESQRAEEAYRDGQWYRIYKPGPLEWYNDPWRFEEGVEYDHYGNGIHELWVSEESIAKTNLIIIE